MSHISKEYKTKQAFLEDKNSLVFVQVQGSILPRGHIEADRQYLHKAHFI